MTLSTFNTFQPIHTPAYTSIPRTYRCLRFGIAVALSGDRKQQELLSRKLKGVHMKFTGYAIKRAMITVVGLVLTVSTAAVAQENRSEVSVQGTGLFTKDSSNNGIQNHATDSGGVLIGYRYSINHWLAAEANYGWSRNTEDFFGGAAHVKTNLHEVTGSAVVKLPMVGRLQPFVRAGGGALVFDPTDNSGNYAGATRQTRGAVLYGAGADYALTRHLLLRAEYRGFVYKASDFNLRNLNSDAWTHTAQPSAGFVYRF